MDDHLRAVARVYGPEAWRVYDLLDRSLDPRGPDAMVAHAEERLTPASAVLDVGCRDGSHLIELVQATGASGVGIDPLPRFVEDAREAVARARVDDRVTIAVGAVEAIPCPDAAFDLVWCRDVLPLVRDAHAATAEIARVLRAGGHAVVFTVFATDQLEPRERELVLGQSLTLVPSSLDRANVEAAFAGAGLTVVLEDVLGTEWREFAEERSQRVSHDLLRLARLRRQRALVVAHAGEDIYAHVESNLHRSVYQFLGKLLPTIYVLRKAPA